MSTAEQFARALPARAPTSAANEDMIMHTYEHALARRRMQEMQEEAQRVSRAHRLYRARKAALRAERAVRRAARLSASVH